MENTENCIEFITGERFCVCTFTNRKHINRIKKIYEDRKDEFKYLHENPDGSVCAKIPLRWIKVNPGSKEGRTMTEEQREAARQRFAKYHEDRKKKNQVSD
jgi:hypothetical protein